MPISKRRLIGWPISPALTLCLFLTLFFLSFTTACKTRIVTVPVAVGGERAVAKVIDGVLIWEPGESQVGQYIVVTKGFWLNALKLEEEVRFLKLRIEQLEAKGDEK